MKIYLVKKFLELHEWTNVRFNYIANPNINQIEVELLGYDTGSFLLLTYLTPSELSEIIKLSQGIR